MGWVTRKGRRYFYEVKRQGNKVRKIYVGTDVIGRAAELVIECRRERREEVRRWIKKSTAAFASLASIDSELVVELAAAVYATTGLRLNVQAARRTVRTQGSTFMPSSTPQIGLPAVETATYKELRDRASRGDREAAAALLPLLNRHPELKERWGDLSRVALSRWIELVCGQDEVAAQAVIARVADLVESVWYERSDKLEELLARHVGLLWLQTHYFDIQIASAMVRTKPEQAYLGNRQQRAQKAYEAAIKALSEYQTRVHKPRSKRVRSRLAESMLAPH